MTGFDLNAIAQLSATRIVDCLVEGTLIASFTGVVLKVVRRQDSRTKFAVWFAALIAIAALPFLEGAWSRGGSLPAASASSAFTLPLSWALYFVGAWALIASCSLVRVFIGVWHLRQLRRSCVPIDRNELDATMRNRPQRKQGIRAVTLCLSDEVQVPTAIGLFQPAVVIPRWTLDELSAAELNQILLHELAHLRRWDDWTNLAQQLVKALFFFHPAVWWIERRISLEREMACDDAVIAETARPRAYAECLVNLAEKAFIQRTLALAQAALGRVRQTSQRVAQILDVNRPVRTKHAWKLVIPLVAVFAGACVFITSKSPRLVAFTGGAPGSATLTASAAHTDSGISDVSIPATPASLRQTAASNRATSHTSLAKQVVKPAVHRKPESPVPAMAQTEAPLSIEEVMHFAKSSRAPMIATQAVFVIFHGQSMDSSGHPLYEIRVWRWTVWHPAFDVTDNKIPPKQT